MNRTERRRYWCEGEGLERIRTMMKRNYSQEQIAEVIGVNVRTLYEWREGNSNLDNVIACKGVKGIKHERVYNNAEGIGRDFVSVFYKDGVEVFWCNQCREFYVIGEYILGNVTCRRCNATNGNEYRRTKQGKVVKREYARRYYKENREKVLEMVYKRHSAMLENEYDYNVDMWREALSHFNGECAYCGSEEDLQREHVIPVSKGGGYVKKNIIPACRYCNMSKLNRDMETWYRGYRHYDEDRLSKIRQWIGE